MKARRDPQGEGSPSPAGSPRAERAGAGNLRLPRLAQAMGRSAAPTIDDAATAAVEHKGSGHPVDSGVAQRVGAHLGADFSAVRVHEDPLAQEASAAIGARAFAHGADVFLGPGESGTDLGLMAHELTHVVQQGAAGQRLPQRKVEVGAADSPAEREADQVATAVTSGQARPAALIVDDGPVGEGQMLKSTFLETLREQVTAVADQELGPEFSAIGCPYIDQYFSRYTTQPASAGEALLRRYAPAVRDARTAGDMIPAVVARVRDGVRAWRATGQPPADLLAAEPRLGQATQPAQPGREPAPPGTAAAMIARFGPGEALDAGVASRMGSALGADLSHVVVHRSAMAAASAADHGARAMAVGGHVAFGAGAYQPGTIEGDALLAHELAHTVQQRDVDPAAMRAPLGDERSEDEAEADRAAAGAVLASHSSTRSVARPALSSWLRSGLSLQRCKLAKEAPAELASQGPEQKAAWIDATWKAGNDSWDRRILDVLRDLPSAEFIAIQRKLDMPGLIRAMGDWQATQLGTFGPIVDGAEILNKKRAAYLAHAMQDFGLAQAEVFALFVFQTLYDDDAHAVAMELANRGKLSKLLRMPALRQIIDARGLDFSMYQEPSQGVGSFMRGLLRGAKRSVKSDDTHFWEGQALPPAFFNLMMKIDTDQLANVGPTDILAMLGDQLFFGVPNGIVGLGLGIGHAAVDIGKGDYDAAGEDLSGTALVVLTALGVKVAQKVRARPSAPPAAPSTDRPTNPPTKDTPARPDVGPEGPGQFTIPGFQGPVSPAEARLGAILARSLDAEAQAATGRLVSRIGKDGLTQLAEYARQRGAAVFLAENGEAGAYALHAANGDLAAARAALPKYQAAVPARGTSAGAQDHVASSLEALKRNKGSVRATLAELNQLGLTQTQMVDALTAMYRASGRDIGGIARLADGTVVLLSRRVGPNQPVNLVRPNGRAEFGTGELYLDLSRGPDQPIGIRDVKSEAGELLPAEVPDAPARGAPKRADAPGHAGARTAGDPHPPPNKRAERAQRLKELAKDPDKGFKVTDDSLREAEVALTLEEKGMLPGPVRRPARGDGHSGDFVDGAGRDWDHKRPRSRAVLQREIAERNARMGKPPPKFDPDRRMDGEYTLEATVKEIRAEIASGEGVLLDLSGLEPASAEALKASIIAQGLDKKVIFFP